MEEDQYGEAISQQEIDEFFNLLSAEKNEENTGPIDFEIEQDKDQ